MTRMPRQPRKGFSSLIGKYGRLLELLAIDRHLLLLAGEALLDHKGHFGAIQADALGATLLRPHHIGEQAGIHPKRNAHTVGGFARQLAQDVQAFG